MLVLDMKKSIPLDPSRLDWNREHVMTATTEFGEVLTVPLHDENIRNATRRLVYDIASRHPWKWPDYEQTTIALQLDQTRPYIRFSLRIGVQPAEKADQEPPSGWEAFEKQRLDAVAQHKRSGGGQVYDTFPVMLTEEEEQAVKCALFDELGIY